MLKKRRTREHIIADLGVNHLERHVLLAGYTIERVQHDYGVDLFLATYDETGEVEPGEIRVQVKATERLKRTRAGRAIRFRLEGRDLRAWNAELMPVLLILYDAGRAEAYWLYVQAYYQQAANRRGLRRRTTTAYVPAENVVNVDTVRRFATFKAAVLRQVGELEHRDD